MIKDIPSIFDLKFFASFRVFRGPVLSFLRYLGSTTSRMLTASVLTVAVPGFKPARQLRALPLSDFPLVLVGVA